MINKLGSYFSGSAAVPQGSAASSAHPAPPVANAIHQPPAVLPGPSLRERCCNKAAECFIKVVENLCERKVCYAWDCGDVILFGV